MENEVPNDVLVPFRTLMDAEGFVYDAAIELSDQIYRWRKAGMDVPVHLLDGLEKAKRVCLDLRKAEWGGDHPNSGRFLDKLQQIQDVGLQEVVRLHKSANCISKSA